MKKKNSDFRDKAEGRDYISGNHSAIYIPIIAGVLLFYVGVLFASSTGLIYIGKLISGFGGLVMALSGIWQIKFRVVPGIPILRGGCAIIFGVAFMVVFIIGSLGFILFD